MASTKQTLLGGAAVAAAVAVLSVGVASAYRGDPSVQGPDYSPERHAVMTEAFENSDYALWKSQMSDERRVTEVVTAENFPKFAQAHQMMVAGDQEGAAAIRAELGLGQGSRGERAGNGQGRKAGQNGDCQYMQ